MHDYIKANKELPNCKYCAENNWRQGNTYFGTHTEHTYYCMSENCKGTILYFYLYRPWIVMCQGSVNGMIEFEIHPDIIKWINNVLTIISEKKMTVQKLTWFSVFTKSEHDKWEHASFVEDFVI